LWTPAAFAQDVVITSPIDGSQTILTQPEIEASAIKAANGIGAFLRGLDKVSGEIVDFDLVQGDRAELGRIEIALGECRYPEDNLAGEAFAWLEIRDPRREEPLFVGWMSASSPALSALDHARYDVWVIRCKTA
ncbi:MAG: DUF2155 domain-containing protein, partial [Boseongicola sp.]|nr:DUF2155 domain-containing protein [Boseongicola sp.]